MIYINYFDYIDKVNEEMTELRNDSYDKLDSYFAILDEVYWFIANYRHSKTDEEIKVAINDFIESLIENDFINSETIHEYDESLKKFLEKKLEKRGEKE